MGFRFRKSVKILPGVKINFNAKSASVTFGGKGAHHTISSTGKRTTSIGIPGTGISYSKTYSKRRKKVHAEDAVNLGEIERHITIANDCVQLINSTANPDVFFDRYDLLTKELIWLSAYRSNPILSGEDPRVALKRITKQREEATNQFVERSFYKELNSGNELKTDQGRKNRLIRYFEKMQEYDSQLFPSTHELLHSLRETYLDSNQNVQSLEFVDKPQKIIEPESASPLPFTKVVDSLKSIKKLHIPSWIFSALFILCGIAIGSTHTLSSALIALGGITLNPVIRRRLNLSTTVSAALSVILIFAGVWCTPAGDNEAHTIDVASERTIGSPDAASDNQQEDYEGSSSNSIENPESSSAATFESMLKTELDNTFGDAYILDANYLDSIFISVFPEGTAASVSAVRNGDEDQIAAWNEFVSDIVELNKIITQKSGRSCIIDIISDQNHHVKFISTLDGEIIYDSVSDS